LSYEGPALAFRLMDAGYDVLYSPQIQVQHFFGREGRTPWRNYYYDTRNQLWLAAQFFPFGYACRYLGKGLLSMLVYALRDWHFGAWFLGVRDGILGLPEATKKRTRLGRDAMRRIRTLDAERPSILYMIRARLFGRGANLEGCG